MQPTTIAGCLILIPTVCLASPCPDFQWHYPSTMVNPESFMRARTAMEEGRAPEAQELFQAYLAQNPEGMLAEGARYALASLPHQEDDPEKAFLRIIDRLSTVREKNSESAYAPWALCRIGELYENVGWFSEANSTFERFLELYPDDPLAGGALLGAGLSFLRNRQYLEAALVFRRVVEEPTWHRNHLEGALGLADATALSRAWKPAFYWYGVVEAGDPTLLRRTPTSDYLYGMAELKVGDPDRAISRFLTIFNLHQDHEEAGHALNRISDYLFEHDHEFLSLWFSRLAASRYNNRGPGRHAEADTARWVASFLTKDHAQDEWNALYARLDVLDIDLEVSWDGVIQTTQALLNAPEPDLADEARFLLAQGYHAKGNIRAAIKAYAHLVSFSHREPLEEKSLNMLTTLLTQSIEAHYRRQAWVVLIRFEEEHQNPLRLVRLDPKRLMMLAEAYEHVKLPQRAMKMYDDILTQYPTTPLREELIARQVFLADEIDDLKLLRQIAARYQDSYPSGKWKGKIAMILGALAVREKQYDQALQYYSMVLSQKQDTAQHTHALRERANVYRITGQDGQAIRDYRQLVDNHSAVIMDRVLLADLLFERQTYDKAAKLYEELLDSEAGSEIMAWAKFRLALSYRHMNNTEEATRLLTEIRRLGQDSEELAPMLRAAAHAVMEELTTDERATDVPKD